MDELEISGRRYISTRRAAKEHKYHSDYIGQLIRAGKVEGQKVGRSWYVVADSLTEYLGKESSFKSSLSPEAPIVKQTPVPEVEDEAAHHVPLKIYKPTEIKKDIPTIRTTRNSLRYLADDSPLYPRIERVVEESVYAEEPVFVIERPRIKKNNVGSLIVRGGLVVAAGVVVFSVVALTSAFVVSTTTVQGETASTAYSIAGI